MRNPTVRSALFDLGAGIVAIVVVLGSCFASARIAFDFRAIFAISGVAFFCAGFARGSSSAKLIWQALRVAAGGLIGVAALIVNNGLHRLWFPASLVVAGILCSAAGIIARDAWPNARIRSIGITTGVLLLLAICTMTAIPNLPVYSSFNPQNQSPVAFTVSVDGQTIPSADLRGHVTVLAFYASWCAACFQELPHVDSVHRQFQNDSRVTIYAVDTGWEGDTPERGQKSLARRHIALPMAFDSGSAARALKVNTLPSLVLLDSDGKMRFVHVGYDMSERLESGLTHHIHDLLDENISAARK